MFRGYGLIKYYQSEGVIEIEGGVTQFCFVEKGGYSISSCSKVGSLIFEPFGQLLFILISLIPTLYD